LAKEKEMVQTRSRSQGNGQPSAHHLRVHLSEWPKNSPNSSKEQKRSEVSSFAITSQPQFVQPHQEPVKVQQEAKPVEPQKKSGPQNVVAYNLVKSGVEHHKNGELVMALKAFQAALKVQMLSIDEEHPFIAHTLANIGAVYLKQGRIFLAGEALEEALEMKKRLRDNCDDEAEKSKILIADVLNNLGNVAFLRGDYALSLYFYQTVLKDCRLRDGPDNELANALHNIGRLHVLKEEWEDALSVLTETLRIERELYGPKNVLVVDTLELIGFVRLSSGDHDDAMISFSEALSIFQAKYGAVDLNVATSLVNIAMVMERRGEFQGAWHAYVTARDVFVKLGVEYSHRGLRAACCSIEAIEHLIESGEQKHRKKHLARFIPIKAEGRSEDSNASLDISDKSPAEAREDCNAKYEL
jgi:tetratricopeptide (TPR) repeat protein